MHSFIGAANHPFATILPFSFASRQVARQVLHYAAFSSHSLVVKSLNALVIGRRVWSEASCSIMFQRINILEIEKEKKQKAKTPNRVSSAPVIFWSVFLISTPPRPHRPDPASQVLSHGRSSLSPPLTPKSPKDHSQTSDISAEVRFRTVLII